MKEKKEINGAVSKYFYAMHMENEGVSDRYKKKSERILDCLNLWLWDAYHSNKLLDLQKVNRCMDSRFCPNCRKFSLASTINNFSPQFQKLLREGYNPYVMSLTIPNVTAEELKPTIKKLNETFRKFFKKLSYSIESREGFPERLIQFDGALKVLEITYNKKERTYHPHFHIIMFSQEYDESLFDKFIKGAYSTKRKQFDYYSLMDLHIRQLWTMAWNGIKFTSDNFHNMSENWWDLLQADIRECDESGIYEVLKYTFKDSDIANYNVFKNMFTALDGQRVRQGHGLLYNLKAEEEAEGEKQSIENYLEKKENPEQLLTREMNDLITVYRDYRKISRFGAKSNILEEMTKYGL